LTYQVLASNHFVRVLQNLEHKKSPTGYPEELPDALKVAHFVSEYLQNGFTDALRGRNKPSWVVPTDDPQWLNKVRYARELNLYHYHIGIPVYEKSRHGDYTSEYVLHYQQLDIKTIKLVDLDDHPPMTLPSESHIHGSNGL
tara:strand:+ start:23 stop:448 length:426 start_codon:yes stop_codon:yes gene_type:complete